MITLSKYYITCTKNVAKKFYLKYTSIRVVSSRAFPRPPSWRASTTARDTFNKIPLLLANITLPVTYLRTPNPYKILPKKNFHCPRNISPHSLAGVQMNGVSTGFFRGGIGSITRHGNTYMGHLFKSNALTLVSAARCR